MATRKKKAGVGIAGLQKKIAAVGKATQTINAKIRAEKQVKTLTKRLAQKVNALEKAKNSLRGTKARARRR